MTLAVAIKAHDMVELHRVLARPSKEITQKTAQAMGITTTGQWGPCEALLLVKEKRQAVGSIDSPHKTGSKGFGDDNLGVKPGKDKSVGRRGSLQLEAWELDLEQQSTSQNRKKEIEEAPSDPKKGHKRYGRILRRRYDGRYRMARKRHMRRHRIARKRRIPTRKHGRRHPIHRRDTDEFRRTGRTRASEDYHQGQFSPNNVNAHVESTGARRREKSSAAKLSADE